MKKRWLLFALTCSGLMGASGCFSAVKDATVGAVTAPSRWYQQSKERRRIEDQRQLHTSKTQTPQQDVAAQNAQSSDFQSAVSLVQQRKFRPALTILDRLLEQQPNNDQLFQWKGDCHYNLLELEKAVAAYQTARELNPNNHLALRGMGFVELYLGHQYAKKNDAQKALMHYNDSISIIRRVLQVWPADSEAQFAKSMAIENATRFMFDRALSLKQRRDTQGAEKVTRDCLFLCNEGIESAKFRIQKHPEQAEPRLIVGNLFLLRAKLLSEFDRLPNALDDIEKAKATYTSILREIAPDHEYAKQQVELCIELQTQWKSQVPQ